MLANVVEDAQTAVTSLVGAIAGVASDKIANHLVSSAGLNAPSSGLGDVGMRFVIRAGVTSVVFGTLVTYMPQTADNIFMSVVFFAGNRALVNDAVLFAQYVLRAPLSVLPYGSISPLPPQKPGAPPSSTGGGQYSSCACN